MNEHTRISTLIDTITELRVQLAEMTAARDREASSAEYRYKWWKNEEAARIAAEAKLAAAVAEVVK